jgi:O-acetyl-ADP-ribose deacetylase (regulator of RNase III)
MTRVHVYGAEVSLVRGDITTQPVDAVVNAANDHLWMGGGVAGAIKRAGGEEIETEAMRLGPIPVGGAVVTGAGKLPARFVIHAAGMGQDLKTDEAKVAAATRSALRRAEERQLSSVALPAIGTGVGGLSPHLCAKAMVGVTLDELATARSLKRVIFVLAEEALYDAFHEEILRPFSRHPGGHHGPQSARGDRRDGGTRAR